VALLHQIHIFSFPSPVQRLFSVETIANPRGILELSPLGTGDKQILVFPGHKIGSVQIVVSAQQILLTLWIAQFESGSGVYGEGRVLRPRLDQRPQGRNRLRGVQPRGDQNRNRVRPRVWELATKAKLLELRRGTDPATIYWYYLPSPRTILLSVSASISVTIRSFFVARATKERSTFSRSRSRRGTRG
jgi:hypothetical protein